MDKELLCIRKNDKIVYLFWSSINASMEEWQVEHEMITAEVKSKLLTKKENIISHIYLLKDYTRAVHPISDQSGCISMLLHLGLTEEEINTTILYSEGCDRQLLVGCMFKNLARVKVVTASILRKTKQNNMHQLKEFLKKPNFLYSPFFQNYLNN